MLSFQVVFIAGCIRGLSFASKKSRKSFVVRQQANFCCADRKLCQTFFVLGIGSSVKNNKSTLQVAAVQPSTLNIM